MSGVKRVLRNGQVKHSGRLFGNLDRWRVKVKFAVLSVKRGYEYKRDSPVYLKVFMVDFYHLIQLSFNYSLKEK